MTCHPPFCKKFFKNIFNTKQWLYYSLLISFFHTKFMNSIPPFANLVAPLIKSASFNCNLVSIDQFPRSQSLCGCDRQTKARPTITAVRGSTATSNLRSNGPEIVSLRLRTAELKVILRASSRNLGEFHHW